MLGYIVHSRIAWIISLRPCFLKDGIQYKVSAYYAFGPGFEPQHHIKLDMVAHAYNLGTQYSKRWRQKDQKQLRVILNYTLSFRPGGLNESLSQNNNKAMCGGSCL